jgi:hypothetical protein
MLRWTLAQIKAKVENDLDLVDELFITPTELTAYINEAIDEAEQEIITLRGDDYFETSVPLTFVQGTSQYAMPATIYANKIRGLIYSSGSIQYEIKRIKNWRKFAEIADINAYGSSIDYQYILRHDSVTANYKIEIYPTPRESGNVATLWFIRNANVLSVDADICDLPEAMGFIFAHVKKSCKAKEHGGEAPDPVLKELDRQRELMVSALTEEVVDNHNEVEMDLSHYEELS